MDRPERLKTNRQKATAKAIADILPPNERLVILVQAGHGLKALVKNGYKTVKLPLSLPKGITIIGENWVSLLPEEKKKVTKPKSKPKTETKKPE